MTGRKARDVRAVEFVGGARQTVCLVEGCKSPVVPTQGEPDGERGELREERGNVG